MTETDCLLQETEGPLWVLTLNRPARLNAFNELLHTRLYEALVRARDDESCRAILLTGSGRGFCAGQDLNDRNPHEGQTDLGETLERYYNPLIRLLKSIPKPVITAVNGVAAGAGANIALATDIVLAAESASFIQSFSRVGLIPDSGGTWHLPRLVGLARAKASMMTATPISATTAQDWGLIWRTLPDDTLMAEARNLALGLAQGPTFALGMIKDAIAKGLQTSLSDQLNLERDMQRAAGRSADYREGVRAFLEKRAPAFTGKSS